MERLIFYSLSEAELMDHGLIDQGLADIRSKGFDSVYLEYRNIQGNFESQRVKLGLAHFCKKARGLGLGIVVDDCYNRLGTQAVRDHPEVYTDSIVPLRVALSDGKFKFSHGGEFLHQTPMAVWLIENGKGRTLTKATEISKHVKLESVIAEGGGCAMTQAKGAALCQRTYKVRGHTSGDLLVLIRRKYEYRYLDLGHPALRIYADQMLGLYDKMKVDGYCWDEPHFGFAFWREDGRSISDRMFSEFKTRFGYDLGPRLIDLWYDVPVSANSPKSKRHSSAMTRLHFAELMEEDLARLEAHHTAKAQKKAGKKTPLIGIHRTMHEETSDDFLIGCSDYFRHNKHTSGGFTDSVFERQDSMITMLHMARSLAAEKGPDAPAYNNSWGFVPTEKHHEEYLSLMGAMKVRWIGHTYRCSHQFGPGYPNHPLWKTIRRHLVEHQKAFKILQDARAVADTAVVYNWRALASFPDNYLHVHRRSLILLARQLTAMGVQFRFISVEQLEQGVVSGNQLKTSTGAYSKVIVPWADLLSAKALETLEEASASVETTIFGPPAVRDAEGADATERFAKLCGLESHGTKEVAHHEGKDWVRVGGGSYELASLKVSPGYRSNEASSYPDHFKAWTLLPSGTSDAIATWNGQAVGVKRGNLRYFSFEAPQYVGLCAAIVTCSEFEKVPADCALFVYEDGKEQWLAGVSIGEPISGEIGWRGQTLALEPTRFFIARRTGGSVRVVLADKT